MLAVSSADMLVAPLQTGSEANGSFSVADITALQQAVASNAAAATSS
jgi:hypothetical protein